MKTKDLSEEQLHRYFLEHVRYEVQMLSHVTWAIKQKISVHEAIKHTPVESYAIHLRNLINFLYPNAPRDDDVCAKDFFRIEETWAEIRPDIGGVLAKAKIRADKEVGHLTTLRQEGAPESKIWDVDGLSAELIPIIKTFCESADKIKLDLDIKPLLSAYYSHVAPSQVT